MNVAKTQGRQFSMTVKLIKMFSRFKVEYLIYSSEILLSVVVILQSNLLNELLRESLCLVHNGVFYTKQPSVHLPSYQSFSSMGMVTSVFIFLFTVVVVA